MATCFDVGETAVDLAATSYFQYSLGKKFLPIKDQFTGTLRCSGKVNKAVEMQATGSWAAYM